MGSKERRQARGDERKEQVSLETRAAELLRARELFTQLFKDESPFVNLGYDHRQRQYALPVIRLLEQEGEVYKRHEADSPLLHFNNIDYPDAELVQIETLPSGRGYNLYGARIDALKFTDGMSREEKLLRQIFIPNPVTIFELPDDEVVRIALFSEEEDVDNLAFLAREICSDFTQANGGFKKETAFTSVGRKIGVMGTFRAAWVDEETKLEFVVLLDAPEDEGERVHLSFRRLPKVEDADGSMTPFGRKPNVSREKVMEILGAKRQRLVAGSFATEGI